MQIIWTEKYLLYNFGPDHPFKTPRALPFLEKVKEFPRDFEVLKPPKAKDEDILLVHEENYLERVKFLSKTDGFLSIDTPVNKGVLTGAYYSVGGSILAANLALKEEKAMNLLGGMHHAGFSEASGFCIFNDHAIAIKKLQKEGKIKRAMVYDLDVHAGQGTQEIFYQDPTVFTISLHQDPRTLYPGTGFVWQKGEGKGAGYNLNIPLPPGTTGRQYLKKLDKVLPILEKFKPDLVFLIFGVDTYKEDPLASLNLEISDYKEIGKRFSHFPKLVIECAGGYSKNVPKLWFSFLEGFLSKKFST